MDRQECDLLKNERNRTEALAWLAHDPGIQEG